tara:strand:+ start:2285 stop:2869 length:585 start_codon:yes stop_codon:yes gene_type:complete
MQRSDAPYSCYKLFLAMKMHFESNYDGVKYHWKTNAKPDSFYKRRDKYFFDKLSRKYGSDIKEFYASQFVNGVNYVGRMLDTKGEKDYAEYQRIHQSIHKIFSDDMYKLANEVDDFDTLLTSSPPAIISYWEEEVIHLETICIIDSLTNFMTHADKNITETISWPKKYRLVTKYKPFVDYDRKKVKESIVNAFG